MAGAVDETIVNARVPAGATNRLHQREGKAADSRRSSSEGAGGLQRRGFERIQTFARIGGAAPNFECWKPDTDKRSCPVAACIRAATSRCSGESTRNHR